MINIVINLFGGQAYEITDRYTAPRSSSANRYRNDPWYTGSLIRKLPLEPHDWLRVMEKVRRRPLEIFSNHPAEIYDAVTEAVMRGELAIYKLPQLDATHCVRGKNTHNTGLCFVRGPDAHCATELAPEPIGSVEAARALLEEIGISEKLFLGELAYKDLYNSYQQRDPMQTALKMLASGEILAYKIPVPPMAKPPKPVEYEDTSGPSYQPVPMAPPTSDSPASSPATNNKSEESKPGNQNPELEARHKELKSIGVDLRKNGFTPSTDEEVMQAVTTGDLGNPRFLVSIQKNKSHDEPVGFRRPDTGRTTMWTTTYDMIKKGDLSAPLLMALLGSTYEPGAEYTMYLLDQGENYAEDGAMTFSPTWENMQKFGPDELHKDNPKDPIRNKALLASVMNEEVQQKYQATMEGFWNDTKGMDMSEYSSKDINKYLAKKGLSAEEQDQFKARHLFRTQIGANAYFLGNGATEFTQHDKNIASIKNDGINIKGTPATLGVPEMLTIEKNPPSIAQLAKQGKLKAIPLTGVKA